MTTYDNAPPLPDWHPDPRPSPFDVRSVPDDEQHLVRGEN